MNEFQFGLGWVKGAEDPRHYSGMQRTFSLAAPADAPEEIDHRGWLRTENQGNMGSCTGHAAADCAEVCNWIATGGQVIQVSRMFCYLMGQAESGLLGRDQGASISGSVSSLNKNGAPLEDRFPYPQRYTTNIPGPAKDEAKQHLLRSVTPIHSYEAAFSFLANGIGAIEIGIDWTAGLASSNGVIELNNIGGGVYGGHALAISGYSKRRDRQGRQYQWLHNSHGNGWGNDGWAEVAPDVIQHWINTGAEFIGVSDMEGYERRYIDTSKFA